MDVQLELLEMVQVGDVAHEELEEAAKARRVEDADGTEGLCV